MAAPTIVPRYRWNRGDGRVGWVHSRLGAALQNRPAQWLDPKLERSIDAGVTWTPVDPAVATCPFCQERGEMEVRYDAVIDLCPMHDGKQWPKGVELLATREEAAEYDQERLRAAWSPSRSAQAAVAEGLKGMPLGISIATHDALIAEARTWPAPGGPGGTIPAAAPADLIRRLADALQSATEVDVDPAHVEYRSAVMYEGGDIRETGPTRQSMNGALTDVEDDEPSLLRDRGEPNVYRAIVRRHRPEPGPWEVVKEIR